METMIWGRITGMRQGLPAQGLWWRNTCPGAALAKEPNPTAPRPEGDRDTSGIPGCIPQEVGAALGTVISSMGMGMGNLAANLWLSSFTINMATMAMMEVTRVPTLVCGSFLQRSMTV